MTKSLDVLMMRSFLDQGCVGHHTDCAVHELLCAYWQINDDLCVRIWSDTCFNFTNYLLRSLLWKNIVLTYS